MRWWTRPSRPRRAAGKERAAGDEAVEGFGASGGRLGHPTINLQGRYRTTSRVPLTGLRPLRTK